MLRSSQPLRSLVRRAQQLAPLGAEPSTVPQIKSVVSLSRYHSTGTASFGGSPNTMVACRSPPRVQWQSRECCRNDSPELTIRLAPTDHFLTVRVEGLIHN